ncbi:MAG: hypothetical protein OEV00_09580 [Acidobacteriota bacterium]|nr:hypothetical protein [Acidobacteriota bacterium]MDH3785562.1 hypothetical protein [Acidobacteriota bacterium]
MKRYSALVLVSLLVIALPAFAEGSIESRVTVEFGGGAKIIKRMTGTAKDGVIHRTAIQNRRMMELAGTRGTLIDLDKELQFDVQQSKQRYQVRSFVEVKDQLHLMQGVFDGGEGPTSMAGTDEAPPIKYVSTLESGPTGATAKHGGYETTEYRWVVTVHQDGMTLEDGGGAVLTATIMVGPKLKVFDEFQRFRQDYMQALELDQPIRETDQKLTEILAGSPALRNAMTRYYEDRGKLNGAPLRTELMLETVPLPLSEEETAKNADAGMLSKIGKKLFKKRQREREEALANGGRILQFKTVNEVLSVSSSSQGLTRLRDYEAR